MRYKSLVLLLLVVVLLMGMTILYLCSRTPLSGSRAEMPIAALDEFYSDAVLGAVLDKEKNETVFRVFAPRAAAVELCLFDLPGLASGAVCAVPTEIVEMSSDRDGVWEARCSGLLTGYGYMFRVKGSGAEFDPQVYAGDPYARAVTPVDARCIVIDPGATNDCFSGWTDKDYSSPQRSKMVIYETNIRDFSAHSSAGVDRELRGKYRGFSATAGKRTGIDHLKKLGVNMIEMMAVAEFANESSLRSSSCGSTHLFAPESSYGSDALNGSQYYEFKQLVNELHGHGFGVIMEVGYGHIDGTATFDHLDSKYYGNLNSGRTNHNASLSERGVRIKAPMMRRLILDNIRYWMEEFHIDGFRFDCAGLIDEKTLTAVRDVARGINPEVLLIADGHGSLEQKQSQNMDGWLFRNDNFSETVRRFVTGKGSRDEVIALFEDAAKDSLMKTPRTVSSLENRDGLRLAAELYSTMRDEKRKWEDHDLRCNCLAATMLFTSCGIPALSAGQEFLRSSDLDALSWIDRRQRSAGETMRYYSELIHMRLSRAGESLRSGEYGAGGHYKWIMPDNNQSLGYIINGDKRYPGAGFIVLLNASGTPSYFDVPFPAGYWRMVGDGRKLDPGGMSGSYTVSQERIKKVLLPAFASRIFVLVDKNP